MFGIGFVKAPPTRYVMHFRNGRVQREGPGLSFFYYAPSSTIVQVPVSSVDIPFVFNEMSADFQSVTLQGQLSYRVSDPKKLAQMLDFSVRASGAWASSDPDKLNERLVNATQVLAAGVTHRLRMREALGAFDAIVSEVLAGLGKSEAVQGLGVEIMGLSLLAISPAPETSKALEAEARESLLRQADEAISARRNAAVAQERMIKENELATELAVEEKRRQIREAKMAADVAAEQQRTALLVTRTENERKEADSRAYAIEAALKPLRATDWRTLMAAHSGGADAKLNIALAFRELAENANKIGELNITPDLLQTLTSSGK